MQQIITYCRCLRIYQKERIHPLRYVPTLLGMLVRIHRWLLQVCGYNLQTHEHVSHVHPWQWYSHT